MGFGFIFQLPLSGSPAPAVQYVPILYDPLSTPSLGITEVGEAVKRVIREKEEGLSTPSLGITS